MKGAANAQRQAEQQRHQLVEKGPRKDGHVEQRVIFALLPETPENAEALDTLYTELADNSIRNHYYRSDYRTGSPRNG